MTLVQNAGDPDRLYQAADFRLSTFMSGRKVGQEDFTSQKAIFVSTFEWWALVAFAGVGSTDGVDISQWLGDRVRPGNWSRQSTPGDLLEFLRSADPWLARIRPRADARHSFCVLLRDGHASYAILVSNFERLSGERLRVAGPRLEVEPMHIARPFAFFSGQRDALLPAEEQRLVELVAQRVEPAAIQSAMADINQSAARREPHELISETCFTAFLTTDGKAAAQTHGRDEDDEPYTPAFADVLTQLGLQLKPALDEHGKPKPIKLRSMSMARSQPLRPSAD
jgi:hypothetical protein